MRLVFWNIRAGGGRRIEWIAEQIKKWRPDVLGLCEFRGTAASQTLARVLADQGLCHQQMALLPERPAANGLLLASRHKLHPAPVPVVPPEPERWLIAQLAEGPAVGVIHAPNYVTGKKRPFFDAVEELARSWRGGPALFGGDTNTGIPPLDGNPAAFHPWEWQWVQHLRDAEWIDAYRHLHGQRRVYSWYSPNANNGYRLDQVYINAQLIGQLKRARYVWGKTREAPARRHALSDHAAVLIELED